MQIKSKKDKKIGELLSEVRPGDLLKFGMIPEFTGRLPVVTNLNELDEDALKKILTEPKNALVKQFQRLFELDNVKLTFEDDALTAVAQKAITKTTGARGLRSIVESCLLEIMYEIPARNDVAEVVFTKECITEGAPPRVVSKMERTGT